MSIKIKYFASLKEALGKSEDEIIEAKVMSASEIWKFCNQGFELPDNVLVAINMEYSGLEDEVKNGDEVAFFPPVTGG